MPADSQWMENDAFFSDLAAMADVAKNTAKTKHKILRISLIIKPVLQFYQKSKFITRAFLYENTPIGIGVNH